METSPTYEFRWDVEIPGTARRYGQKFMKQWKRVLQAQKMTPLVSLRLAPQDVRFQLCVTEENAPEIDARAAEIAAELARLRRQESPAAPGVRQEGADRHPAGWQGVRVWMTFARQDVESALGKKPKV